LLEAAQTQEDQLFYLFHLRTVKQGWTMPQREDYFSWLNRAQHNYIGGASFKLFLQKIREDAIATLDEQEKLALAPMLKPPSMPAPSEALATGPPRPFVQNWKMEDLLPKLDQLEAGRSFERGRAAFAAVSCLQCHVFNGIGGGSGPDITGVGSRFQPADLLEAIIHPSRVISDQYQATHIVTSRKDVFVGTVEAETDEYVVLRPSPFSTRTEKVLKQEITSKRPSKVSVMPEGLIDVLHEGEVLDLLAYLRSGGNAHDPAFQPSAAAESAATGGSAP
jgi:putative heme-binding domain-containing protein